MEQRDTSPQCQRLSLEDIMRHKVTNLREVDYAITSGILYDQIFPQDCKIGFKELLMHLLK